MAAVEEEYKRAGVVHVKDQCPVCKDIDYDLPAHDMNREIAVTNAILMIEQNTDAVKEYIIGRREVIRRGK